MLSSIPTGMGIWVAWWSHWCSDPGVAMGLNPNAVKTRVVQLLDLRHVLGGGLGQSWEEAKLTRNEQANERMEWCYFASPYDAPSFLRFFRRLNVQQPGDKAHFVESLGVTMEYDCFTFGVKVYVKHDRPTDGKGRGRLTIYVEDAEGREVVAKYEDA